MAAYGPSVEETIAFAAPVSVGGQVVGCWRNLASVSLVSGILADVVRDLKAGGYAGAVLTVVDSTGRALATAGVDSLAAPLVVAQRGEHGAVTKLLRGESGNAVAELNGEPMQLSYAHLRGALGYPGMNWGVMIAVPQAEVDAAANIGELQAMTLALALGAGVIVVLLGLWIGRRLARPITNLADYVRYAKESKDGITFASSGSGSSLPLSGEMFKMQSKLKMLHVPYRGSAPAVTDLLGGQVDSMFDNTPSALPHVQAGKLRAIAITSAQRSPLLPDVPTLAESGYAGFDVQS